MLVRIVGVNKFKDRHGIWRCYYRRKGAPRVAIDPSLSNAALAAEVARLDAKYLVPKAKAGTLRQLIGEYKTKSDHWASLRPRTRTDYERVFAWLGDAVDEPLSALTPPTVAMVRDAAREQHEPKFANQVVVTLKKVLQFGKEYGFVKANAADGISKATGGNTRENRPPTPKEAIILLDTAPRALLPIIALALYTGLRLGDICGLSKSADEREWLKVTQGKTRKTVVLRISDDLRWILDGIPKNDSTTICVKDDLRPWTYEGIKTAFQRHRDALVKKGLLSPGVTFHGLRHFVATVLAENGFEEAQYGHQLGHGPKSVSGLYGMSAERRDLLTKMGATIEQVLRDARGNIARIGNAK